MIKSMPKTLQIDYSIAYIHKYSAEGKGPAAYSLLLFVVRGATSKKVDAAATVDSNLGVGALGRLFLEVSGCLYFRMIQMTC